MSFRRSPPRLALPCQALEPASISARVTPARSAPHHRVVSLQEVHPRKSKLDRMERAVVRGRWKLITSTRGRRELYDMVSDPTESTELSASRADVARELEGLLQDWATTAERQRPARKAPERDGNLLQRLRALGYLQ